MKGEREMRRRGRRREGILWQEGIVGKEGGRRVEGKDNEKRIGDKREEESRIHNTYSSSSWNTSTHHLECRLVLLIGLFGLMMELD